MRRKNVVKKIKAIIWFLSILFELGLLKLHLYKTAANLHQQTSEWGICSINRMKLTLRFCIIESLESTMLKFTMKRKCNGIMMGLTILVFSVIGKLQAQENQIVTTKGVKPVLAETKKEVPISWNQAVGQALANLPKRNLGPGTMSGRVTALAVPRKMPYQSLNRNVIYAGTASGGIWKSENGGVSWTPIFDEMDVQSIGALAIDPNNASVIYAGTGEGNPRNSHNSGKGIYKSLDGGKTWKCLGLESTRTIHRIAVNPLNSNQIFVAAMGSVWGADNNQKLPQKKRGVYRSDDGGKTWKNILYVNATTGCAEMVMDPQNPNKIFAAMYDFMREPWAFRSGGPGSGLYVTYDGGENWKKLTEKDGLPKGDLGRIGLAVTASNTNRVYAIIEAKDGGFYRSTDGGNSWSRVSTDANAGNRPFYYSEIYAHPYNENRVYSIWSQISKSDDGGKSWGILADWGAIHPDHHAFLIHPDDPDYIINGNDGGLNISYDGGNSWRYAENLPVGQFYHVDVDNELPYNIYGGLQDNGSWVGPAYHFKNGGITNWEWQEVMFGDGFDVAPIPGKPGEGYAMWQGGNVYHFNTKTHENLPIKPQHPDGVNLRYNWNAAMLVDPANPNGLYFGSQFLHYSSDNGNTWKILSPDLTTNNPSKQQQAKSGGISIDATGAENHCTILAIAAAANDNGLIWVTTDDGNIQVSRDGGKSWENVAKNIKNLPVACWIPYVWANPNINGECWVVANNYRQNDWGTYVYKTADYGKTWKLMTQNNLESEDGKLQVFAQGNMMNEDHENSVSMGYAWCVLPDLVQHNLVFMGTDRGLFVSFNGGTTWRKWKKFPSVPVADMKIQARDRDLVIGTFGRGIWVVDDIAVLRDLASKVNPATGFNGKEIPTNQIGSSLLSNKKITIVSASTGYLAKWMQNSGAHFGAGTQFEAPNKAMGVQVDLYVNGVKNKDEWEKMKCVGKVYNQDGKLIRTHKFSFDSSGYYRIPWRMVKDGIRYASHGNWKPEDGIPAGGTVSPGKYKLVIAQEGNLAAADSVWVEVKASNQVPFIQADYDEKMRWMDTLAVEINRSREAFEALKNAEKMIEKAVNAKYSNDSINTQLKKYQQPLLDSIAAIKLLFMLPDGYRFYEEATVRLMDVIGNASGLLDGCAKVNENVKISVKNAQRETQKVMEKVNGFFASDYAKFVALANAQKQYLEEIKQPQKY